MPDSDLGRELEAGQTRTGANEVQAKDTDTTCICRSRDGHELRTGRSQWAAMSPSRSTRGHKQMLRTARGKKYSVLQISYNLQCHLAEQSCQSNWLTPASERQRAWAGPRERTQGLAISALIRAVPVPAGRLLLSEGGGPHRHGATTFHSELDLPFSEQVGKLRPHWKVRRKKQHLWNKRMETSVCFLHSKTGEHVRAWCIIIDALEKFWGYGQQPFFKHDSGFEPLHFPAEQNSEVVQSRGWKAKSPRICITVTKSLLPVQQKLTQQTTLQLKRKTFWRQPASSK